MGDTNFVDNFTFAWTYNERPLHNFCLTLFFIVLLFWFFLNFHFFITRKQSKGFGRIVANVIILCIVVGITYVQLLFAKAHTATDLLQGKGIFTTIDNELYYLSMMKRYFPQEVRLDGNGSGGNRSSSTYYLDAVNVHTGEKIYSTFITDLSFGDVIQTNTFFVVTKSTDYFFLFNGRDLFTIDIDTGQLISEQPVTSEFSFITSLEHNEEIVHRFGKILFAKYDEDTSCIIFPMIDETFYEVNTKTHVLSLKKEIDATQYTDLSANVLSPQDLYMVVEDGNRLLTSVDHMNKNIHGENNSIYHPPKCQFYLGDLDHPQDLEKLNDDVYENGQILAKQNAEGERIPITPLFNGRKVYFVLHFDGMRKTYITLVDYETLEQIVTLCYDGMFASSDLETILYSFGETMMFNFNADFTSKSIFTIDLEKGVIDHYNYKTRKTSQVYP